MNLNDFDPKKSDELFGLKENFNFFVNLIKNNCLPKITLLTGEKGIGKSTLVNHLINFHLDFNNYDLERNSFINKSHFYKQFLNNLCSSVIYLNYGNSNISVNDIRNLKNQIFQTSLNKKERFIIMDDIDSYNLNCLNALLKILEEPSENTYFFLINNKSKSIIQTIKSRCIEIKIHINSIQRNTIIDCLMKKFGQSEIFEKDIINVSPGYYLIFSHFFQLYKIDLKNNYLDNLDILLKTLKNENKFLHRDLILFYVEYYLQKKKLSNSLNNFQYIQKRSIIMEKINDYFLYNLNQKTLLNSLDSCYNG